jgi:hypothetical protein
MLIAPAWTTRSIHKLVETDGRIRAIALIAGPLAFASITLPLGHGDAAGVLRFFGWMWAAATVWLLVMPGSYRDLVRAFLRFFESSGELSMRVSGLIAVGIGVWLVDYGLSVG